LYVYESLDKTVFLGFDIVKADMKNQQSTNDAAVLTLGGLFGILVAIIGCIGIMVASGGGDDKPFGTTSGLIFWFGLSIAVFSFAIIILVILPDYLTHLRFGGLELQRVST
jgi:hypothetical protein